MKETKRIAIIICSSIAIILVNVVLLFVEFGTSIIQLIKNILYVIRFAYYDITKNVVAITKLKTKLEASRKGILQDTILTEDGFNNN